MSFNKELKWVMAFSLGMLAYLMVASAAMIFVRGFFGEEMGETAFNVAWLVVLIIPFNFAVCSIVCIIIYGRKERKMKEIQEHLTELSDMAVFDEDDKSFDYDKKRDDRLPFTTRPATE